MTLTYALALGLAMQAAPTGPLVEAARAALLERARESGIEAIVEPVGRTPVLASGPGDADAVNAQVSARDWLRPRVPVTVSFLPADRLRPTTVTLWFAVSAPTSGPVYATDLPRGTAASQVESRPGVIDLARTHGERPLPAPMPGSTGRLRRAVRAGEPVLASDLEPVPTVQARRRVGIEAVVGVVRIVTQGTALADGDIGDAIPVLPDHAAQPVEGRVVSPEVVRIEH